MTTRMPTPPDARKVIVGVDTHKHVHVAVAIDSWGICSAPGFLDSGLTVFASYAAFASPDVGHVAPGRGFDSGTSPASTAVVRPLELEQGQAERLGWCRSSRTHNRFSLSACG